VRLVSEEEEDGGGVDAEAEEARALDDGGSGSSHGRLRSSRRTAFPRTAFDSSSPPSPPPSSSPVAVWTGEDSPSRRLGLGEPRGPAAWLLIAAGAQGHVDDHDAAAARGGTPRGRHGGLPGALARRRQ
jgi:hypothetical protein